MAVPPARRIFDALPQGGMHKHTPKMVVWLVPSDPILVQTTTNLMNPDHPYTRRLNADFNGRVGVFTKEMLLNGQNFTPDTVHEQLTVCILSYGSLRIDSKKKDVRKVYQENGNLKNFADYFKDESELLADTPDTALIQALRHLSPVVIVDESHNAGSDLSVEMLNNLNPSFVLDLTATPRKNSNIISYVDARKLKKENMVKLPVIVYNRTSRDSVIDDAIHLRGILEQQAIEEEERTGAYIRPIVLFQAQPKNNNDNDTFDKVKEILLGRGIPEEQIAIKTSKVNDLGKTNLMSRDCPIRYNRPCFGKSIIAIVFPLAASRLPPWGGFFVLCRRLIFHNGDFGHGCLALLQNLFDFLQRCTGVDHLAALGAFQAGDMLDNDDAIFQFCHVGGEVRNHVTFAVKTIHAFFLLVL